MYPQAISLKIYIPKVPGSNLGRMIFVGFLRTSRGKPGKCFKIGLWFKGYGLYERPVLKRPENVIRYLFHLREFCGTTKQKGPLGANCRYAEIFAALSRLTVIASCKWIIH
jgi:hypothetical protein